MELLEAIMTRRSVRDFTGKTVSDKELETLLRAASQAPSAHNRQPWHFVIIKDKEILEKIADFHPYAKMLPGAGCGIVVCGDNAQQKSTGFMVADCSAAILSILLTAHDIGLGAVWCGLYPKEQLIKPMSALLGLPDTVIPVGMVPVGYPKKRKSPEDRYDKSRIHSERW